VRVWIAVAYCRSEPQIAAWVELDQSNVIVGTWIKHTHGGDFDDDVVRMFNLGLADFLHLDLVRANIVDGLHSLGSHGDD
jgi:hypothetical protein